MALSEPSVRIEEYRLELEIDRASRSWRGRIAFDVETGKRGLRLDADGLRILSAQEEGRDVPFALNEPEERLTLEFAQVASRHRLAIAFAGTVAPRSMLGLYESRTDRGSVLTTQCAATAARRIFPCRDRPDAKARFRLTVLTDPDADVVANTRATSTERAGARRRWTFAPTPPMATYLFYLGVGSFERVRRAGSRVSVVVAPGLGERGQFAAALGEPILRFFETYYGIPYPLDKLDLVGVRELPWGGMENWGAIVFQESRLLVDERTSERDRHLAVTTIAHEIAHQWFGNLVTMPWWSEIWLNESFATYMAYRAVDALDPGSHPRDDFLAIASLPAFERDSLASAAPIRPSVRRTEEISSVFDPALAYGKGASLLAMVAEQIGESAFRRGVGAYLAAHAYGTATTGDLWRSLGAAAGEEVGARLEAWIGRPGHPVVEVRPRAEGIELRQRRFLYDRRPTGELWPIPIVYAVGGEERRIWMTDERQVLPGTSGAPVEIDPRGSGFYRVLYDADEYRDRARRFATFPGELRWKMLVDLGDFAIAGEVPFATYARFVRASFGATERPVVEAIASTLTTMAEWAPDAPAVGELARGFLAAQLQRLGPRARSPEPVGSGIVRERVASARARLDPGFARQASELYLEWDRTDPALREAAAIGRARSDPRTAAAELRHRLARHPPAGEGLRLELALAWIADPAEVERTLDDCLNGTIHKGNASAVLIEAVRNPIGRRAGWRWWQRHTTDIAQFFRNTIYLPTVVRRTIPLVGPIAPEAVRRLFAPATFPEAEAGIRQGLEAFSVAVRFASRVAETPPR